MKTLSKLLAVTSSPNLQGRVFPPIPDRLQLSFWKLQVWALLYLAMAELCCQWTPSTNFLRLVSHETMLTEKCHDLLSDVKSPSCQTPKAHAVTDVWKPQCSGKFCSLHLFDFLSLSYLISFHAFFTTCLLIISSVNLFILYCPWLSYEITPKLALFSIHC